MRNLTAILILMLGIQFHTSGQSQIVKDFTPACDSLAVLYSDHSGVKGKLQLKAVMKRGRNLDFYFTESLGDFPFYNGDLKWLRKKLKALFPQEYSGYSLGEIYTRKVNAERLELPHLGYDGKPVKNYHKVSAPLKSRTIVTPLHGTQPSKGLTGRHIALWQSHGRYFDQDKETWQWQRPCLFQTCEDMFTQGFVLPYLAPMLENAGAYLLMPRERDTQRNEVIVDNDPSYGARGHGEYSENGKWTEAGYGFADTSAFYLDKQNPFKAGTARYIECISHKSKQASSVRWTPVIPEDGKYAVYVSYKTVENSTSSAHYTVSHLGGESEFVVNQKMGGGTWIYLGTFEFAKGSSGSVNLTNRTPEGYSFDNGSVITADAVRFGGGMGNIARSMYIAPDDTLTVACEPVVSGLPRYAEGARYSLQWAGADTTLYWQNEGKNDYRDDFMSRGDWVEWISRGSRINPKAEGGLGIPVDLSFGFHTDAGVTPNDSLVGTLAIYTYKNENKTKWPSGEDRLTSRMYADIVQSQIVNDLRQCHDSLWTRRSIWDRGYRESRTPSCPAMLLELLSHQNFADMKYGLDPSFRFTVSRAVYKGMLKYLSNRYGCEYAVQPLPVDHLGVEFKEGNSVSISWKPVSDPLEPTANPTGYIVYKRIGSGAFDKGTVVPYTGADKEGYIRFYTDIPTGEVVSFKVAAYNEGGLSFPSETVSIGRPANCHSDSTIVLIVNNFDRVSGPAWFDGQERAGFDKHKDSGISYISDITHVGEMYNFNRCDEWISNDRPGFGASYSDMAGEIIAGNTFDYPAIHGKAMLEAGHAFYSCSNERFISDEGISQEAWTTDLICGKQITLPDGRYSVFPESMKQALKEYTSRGGNLIVSGAYIGTDVCGSGDFVTNTLGYKYITSNAGRHGQVKPWSKSPIENLEPMEFSVTQNSTIYCIESADAIAPASKNGQIAIRYSDSNLSAGVAYQGEGRKVVSYGFPIETLQTQNIINKLIVNTLQYIKK